MKKGVLVLPLSAMFILSACGQIAEEVTLNDSVVEPNEQSEGSVEVALNTSESVITWAGRKIGISEHNGTIELSEGTVLMEEGRVVGGSFEINMDTIENTDLSGNSAQNLVDHLKSEDFFEVDAYPTAQFVITDVDYTTETEVQLSGNFTMKGETNNITFPATITETNSTYEARAEFSIDRSKWNVRYGSDKFFDNLGDQAIDNMMSIGLELVTEPV